MTETFPVLPADIKHVSITLGSGSSRKPSAKVTIMAINAEISPATCICKKKLMFHFNGTQFHKGIVKGYYHKSSWRPNICAQQLPSTRSSEQSCHCELVF